MPRTGSWRVRSLECYERGVRRRGWFVAAAAVSCLVAACTSAISGHGHTFDGATAPPTISFSISLGPTSAPSSVPSSSGSAPAANPLACPHVSFAAGRLAFSCLTNQLQHTPGDPVWELTLSQPVEPTWEVAEGARRLTPLGSRTLKQVALANRAAMLAHNEYGDSPQVATVEARAATVAGVPAFVLQSAITINPTFRAANGLQVRVEKLWIVAMNAGDGNVASWYVTIPDDVRQLWPKVPALIASIGLI